CGKDAQANGKLARRVGSLDQQPRLQGHRRAAGADHLDPQRLWKTGAGLLRRQPQRVQLWQSDDRWTLTGRCARQRHIGEAPPRDCEAAGCTLRIIAKMVVAERETGMQIRYSVGLLLVFV